MAKNIEEVIKKAGMPVKVIAGAVGAVFLFFVVISFQSDEFHIERDIIIAAAPVKVFAKINDFHEWQNWMPWDKQNKKLVRTFEGTDKGTGSVYHWEGSMTEGSGTATITDSDSKGLVKIKLEYQKPLPKTVNLEFYVESSPGNQSYVKFRESGSNTFADKVSQLFNSMDASLGAEMQTYLEGLKSATQPNYGK